eukprot:s755_g4.t1
MLSETLWNSSLTYTQFPDYDCQWAGSIAHSTETWSRLREQLLAGMCPNCTVIVFLVFLPLTLAPLSSKSP